MEIFVIDKLKASMITTKHLMAATADGPLCGCAFYGLVRDRMMFIKQLF
jgi:hypothetical protein